MITDEQIENREKNLKLHYETLRKDLDITLSTMIPTQKNLMKTIMWVNAIILGLIVNNFQKLEYAFFMIPSFTFSGIAFGLILYSLKKGRSKTLGHIDTKEIENIDQNRFESIIGLQRIIVSTEKAINDNSEIIKSRGKKIADAINFTMLSVSLIFLYAIFLFNLILRGKEVMHIG